MDCAEFIRMMNSYLDGDLEGALRAEVESHLAECPDCCGEVADWQTCLDWLRKTFPEQVPSAELWEKIQCRTRQQGSR